MCVCIQSVVAQWPSDILDLSVDPLANRWSLGNSEATVGLLLFSVHTETLGRVLVEQAAC